MSFWELIIANPNGGQWASFSYVCPSWLKPLVTPLTRMRGTLFRLTAKEVTPARCPKNKVGLGPRAAKSIPANYCKLLIFKIPATGRPMLNWQ